jgi:dephospho-CoA kinase
VKVKNKNGSINRKKLGEKVFADSAQLQKLNAIMWKPVLVRLRRELIGKEGIILIVSALLAEAKLLAVCNNRIILVSAQAATQRRRLKERGFSPAQINRRLRSQYSTEKKRTLLTSAIAHAHFGKKWEITEKTNMRQFARQLLREVS